MREYILLDSDAGILSASWPSPIAVDFEGEFNLHVYGEHLCLIQIFNGSTFYVIDPRSGGVTREGLIAFFQSPVEKVWFDCQSDAALVYRNYGTGIQGIFDIRVLARLLGYDGNLSGLVSRYLGIEPESGKKRKQTSNWLRRPIPDEQMEYALSDVEHLLELKDVLVKEIEAAGLQTRAEQLMRKVSERKIPEPGWKKLPGWKNMPRSTKVYARNIFVAREKVAERFNVPPARVMDKHLIVSIAENPPDGSQLDMIMRSVPPRFHKFMSESVRAALEKSRREL